MAQKEKKGAGDVTDTKSGLYAAACGHGRVNCPSVEAAACHFLAPVPPKTLRPLSAASLCHLEAVSKRQKHEGIFLTPPQVHAR